MKIIGLIAVGKDNAIGSDNRLPWRCPEDLKEFKNMTLNKTIIIGSKTYESIPGGLPDRNIIVLTRQKNKKSTERVTYLNSVKSVLMACKKRQLKEVYVCGGKEIYELFKTKIHEWKVSRIVQDCIVKPDTFICPTLFSGYKLGLFEKLNTFERETLVKNAK